MIEDYPARRQASETMSELSTHVLLTDGGVGIDDFVLRGDYHSLDLDLGAAYGRFLSQAPEALRRTNLDRNALVAELATAVARQDSPYIGAVGELSWLVGQGGYAYSAYQISARRKEYVLAQPVFSLYQNVDVEPISIGRLSFAESFERSPCLDLSAASPLEILPGEQFSVNGFRELVWFEESGKALLSVATLPLGAYEATYRSSDGTRVGLFSTEMRLSSIDVALRTLAAAGWGGAMDIADRAANSAVRELRWAALNYVWRTAPPDLPDRLARFVSDPDPEIARIARSCVASEAARSALQGAAHA